MTPCPRKADFKLTAKQPLVQKPNAARVQSRRLPPYELCNLDFLHREKKALQNGKIQALVFEGKSQMPLK